MDLRRTILPLRSFPKLLLIISTITITAGFKLKQNGCLPLNSGKHPCLNLNYSFFIQCPENWVHITVRGFLFFIFRDGKVSLRFWRGVSFILWSNGFALRAGQSVGLVFSLSWFSRRWRGAGFFFWSSGLRFARARGREGCFESPLPTSGLHSPRNELRATRP